MKSLCVGFVSRFFHVKISMHQDAVAPIRVSTSCQLRDVAPGDEMDEMSSGSPTSRGITHTHIMRWLAVLFSSTFSPPSPLPEAHIRIDLSSPGTTVSPELYGHDLEFTRHDLYEGFSAEMLANRKFTTLVDTASWPAQTRQLAASGIDGAARWEAIGNASLDAPLWANVSGLVSGDLGHSIRCQGGSLCGVTQRGWLDGFNAGASFGSAIAVEEGVDYVLRLVLKSAADATPSAGGAVVASLSSETGALLWSQKLPFPDASDGWVPVTSVVSPKATTSNATLRVVATTAPATWWLGSASLSRADATPEGLRPDVVAAVGATKFHGLLRYPGGCFSSFYRWQVGLLPADQRPPIATPPGFCAAVPGGVDAYSDGVVANGIGTDEYMSLVRRLGATAAVTVRLSLGNDAEIAEAAAWVEYLNGNSSTTHGALRSKRLGHTEPYAVRYFYLGNELWQERCPHYPRDTSCSPGPSAKEYAAIASRLVAAMEAASPTPLRLLTAMSANPDDGWDKEWIDAVGAHVYAASDHDGYHPQPAAFEAAALTSCAKAPRDVFAAQLRRRRAALDAKGAAHVAISADEWGLGPPWLVATNFSVAHGVYAAAFLGVCTRIAPEVRLAFTNYFEPVNEGAVYVGPFGASLTPVGQAMALYADHAGGARLNATQHEDLDVLATLHEGGEGGGGGGGGATMLITVVGLDATAWRPRPVVVALDPPPAKGTTAAVVTLTASGFDERSTFSRATSSAAVGEDGTLSLTVPPFSIVRASVEVRAK